MKESLAVLSLVIALAANVPYLIGTVRGDVKPERISWLLWTMLGATYFTGALFENGAVLFTSGELIGPGLILLFSLKYGVGGRSRFDLVSFFIALLAFGLLFVVEGALVSLLLALVVDGIGGLLTIRKVLADPASEPRLAWAMSFAASFLALLSLAHYSLETVLFPMYVLLFSGAVFWLSNPRKVEHVEDIEEF